MYSCAGIQKSMHPLIMRVILAREKPQVLLLVSSFHHVSKHIPEARVLLHTLHEGHLPLV